MEGLEKIPASGPLIVAGNHLSYLDPFAHAFFVIRRAGVRGSSPSRSCSKSRWSGRRCAARTDPGATGDRRPVTARRRPPRPRGRGGGRDLSGGDDGHVRARPFAGQGKDRGGPSRPHDRRPGPARRHLGRPVRVAQERAAEPRVRQADLAPGRRADGCRQRRRERGRAPDRDRRGDGGARRARRPPPHRIPARWARR